MWFWGAIYECYGCRGGVLCCNVFAAKNQMFKTVDMWGGQQRGVKSAAIKNSEATPSTSGPGLAEVVIPRGAGLIEDRENMWLLPGLCKTENVYILFCDVVVDKSSFICQ